MSEGTARYLMIGGFLGAGKTTAVLRLARYLTEKGSRVGLISNDQSTGLVDTAMMKSKGFPVEEIAGGCFCCRFDSLLGAANRLTKETRPDIFIAEPVGSCTDLLATVSYPLRRIYGDQFTISPLSVLIDPHRAAKVFGLAEGRKFSEKVVYVYKKQLEEANVIVINKCDTIDAQMQNDLKAKLAEMFPQAEIVCCSALTGSGVEEWFEQIISAECNERDSMPINYDLYAEGEALLGWLNTTIKITSNRPFEAHELLLDLCSDLRDRLTAKGIEIAHLKMTLDPEDPSGNLAVVSLVTSDSEPDLRESLMDEVEQGDLVLNLRAEADPDELRKSTEESMAALSGKNQGLIAKIDHLEFFRPGKPEPTHRVTHPAEPLATTQD